MDLQHQKHFLKVFQCLCLIHYLGQEVANKNYIEKIGAGILINKENLDMLIDRIKTDENYLSRLSLNAKTYGKPHAADDICKIILKRDDLK